MKQKYFPPMAVLVTLIVLVFSVLVVRAAGGRIEGKVTDPKGAAIVGATVRVTDSETNQSFTATTDAQGQYKIEGLATGTYTVVVTAKGFSEGRLDNVKVDEGAAAPGDVRLEIAALEAEVNVNAGASRPNTDSLYQQLRQQAKSDQEFAGPYASVSNLILKRDAATFTLKSGEIYFVTTIDGRVTGGVFIGEGEMTLTPPTAVEKRSLEIFIGSQTLTEQFTHLVIHFTDKTFEEIKSSPQAVMGTSGKESSRARDLYRENQQLLRKQLRDNGELRTLADFYAPPRPGFFNAFIDGKKHSKLLFLVDPLGIPFVAPEEVVLISYGATDGGIWTAFHLADEYRKGSVSNAEDHRIVDMIHHEIDATIKGVHITASDVVTFRSLAGGSRVIPFNLYRTLRVSRVQDEQGKDLSFIQESKDEDADFGVILPQALEAGKTYKLTVQYDGGEALRDSGGGNFILIPRLSWYPNNGSTQFGDRATFDMTFHYPKGAMLVGTTAPVGAETHEGDVTVAKWSSGKTDLAVAGFNYGRFKKKELIDKQTGYNIEFYANLEVPDELRAIQARIDQIESSGSARQGNMGSTGTTLGSISTTAMGDTAIGDAQNATRIYDAYFGKLPYTRIAMTQQPAANFGQAWPTLIFMPYLAFVDSTQRAQLLGTRGGGDNFWKYVAPHEVSHQWWGHIVGWDSYHDQWMSEGFAEFSASLYVQAKWGNQRFIDFWEDQRKRIIEATPRTRDLKPYTVGPVTQGFRLSNAKTGAAYQFLVYPKGAYILHMLRMMMYQAKGADTQFQVMMHDFVKSHFNQDVSTEDFKRIVEKHMTKEMDIDHNGKMDWFFDEWVYGTEMPSYRFDYQIAPDGTLSGKVTQSGVSDKFVMLVPIYLDFGKGWAKLGTVTLAGNSTVDLGSLKLPAVPKQAAIIALNDVLASSVQNSKGGR